MNIERLKTISNYLKNPPKGFTQGFNMSGWGGLTGEDYPDLLGKAGECGTAHCIAGLANVFWGGEPMRYTALFDISKEILDLEDEQASELFYARGSDANLEDVTLAQAVQAIDSLIETGTVIWRNA